MDKAAVLAEDFGEISAALTKAHEVCTGVVKLSRSIGPIYSHANTAAWALSDAIKRIEKVSAAVAELIETATRANGDHHAPDDCYATGPLTGNPIADLVACPGCALKNALARVGGAS